MEYYVPSDLSQINNQYINQNQAVSLKMEVVTMCECSENTENVFRMAPYRQFQNAGNMNIFQCPRCRQRWFCYNDHFRLWGKVDDDLTWKFMTNGITDVPFAIGENCSIMPGYEKYAVDPVSEICVKRVHRPAVRVEKILDSETIVVQWSGEYDLGNIFGYQFIFPIKVPDKYMGNISYFRIPYIGQIRNWPDQAQVKKIATNFDDSEMKKCIVHLMSTAFSQDKGGGKKGPASFIAEVVLLGDFNVGLIQPSYFYDYTIAEMTQEEFDEKNSP